MLASNQPWRGREFGKLPPAQRIGAKRVAAGLLEVQAQQVEYTYFML